MNGRQIRIGSRIALLIATSAAIAAAPASARNVYVANLGDDTVSVLDAVSGAPVRPPVAAHQSPTRVAVAPGAAQFYATNNTSDSLSVIDVPAFTGFNYRPNDQTGAHAVAVTPDGTRVYYTNRFDDSVTVFDPRTKVAVGPPVVVGDLPMGIAITPDGTRAYVANVIGDSLSVIDTGTNTVVTTIPVPAGVDKSLAITPDGKTLLVGGTIGVNYSLSFIDTATGSVSGPPLVLPDNPEEVAINPSGTLAFATLYGPDQVLVIDLSSRTLRGAPIAVGQGATGVAVANTSAGQRAYVTNSTDDTVSIIDVGSATVVNTVPVGDLPEGIAVAPNQAPTAALALDVDPLTRTVTFSAAASSDSDGSIGAYVFNFGDETSESSGASSVSHTYAAPGLYEVSLRVFDNEGCSVSEGYTGQTLACNAAGGTALTTGVVDLLAPEFKLGGKKRQKAGGKLKLKGVVNEPVELQISGKVKVKRPPAGRQARLARKPIKIKAGTARLEGAATPEPFKVKLPPAAKRAFKAGAPSGVAKITVIAVDATGNQTAAKRKVRLKPRSTR